MARLNDPPPDPTSLDILKRRFTRQNRDLARTNSAQSLRIRNLETEISRLVSENLELRQAAITAQKESERWRLQSGLAAEVAHMKERMERKLKEVSEMVEELGGLPEKAGRRGRRSEGRRENVLPREMGSPDQRDWRNRQTVAGVLGGGEHEGRLPVIVEDKLYPRRTLEPLDAQILRNEVEVGHSESPDLGPPPVAHFEKMERGSWGEGMESPEQENTLLEEGVVLLPSNLETRRKRRTSSLLQDMAVTDSQSESDTQESRPGLFKSGAKRKLDVTELEEPRPATRENDDFVYQRRPALKPMGRKTSRFSMPAGQQQGDIIIPATEPLPQKDACERRALAPKSTNSPSKRPVNIDGKDLKAEMKDIDRGRVSVIRNISTATQSRGRPRKQQSDDAPKSDPPSIQQEPGDHHELPPKTPAILEDILSPVSTEPSASNNTKRAPQEAAIINSVEDVLNGSIGRGSRRARAAVSYAEPNLRDKMRRPGKELVSAVEGLDRKSREASMGADLRRSQSEHAEQPIKTEPGAEAEKWKKLPTAEVRIKKEEPTSPLSDKKKHDEARDKAARERIDEPPEKAAKRHERKKAVQEEKLIEDLDEQVKRLNIFDPPSSSPADPRDDEAKDTSASAPTAESTARRKRQPPTSSASRRHSMALSSQLLNSSVLGSRSTNAPSLQRPSSAASGRGGSGTKSTGVELKRSTSVASLKHGGGENGDDGAGAGARADRVASRRRSMMI